MLLCISADSIHCTKCEDKNEIMKVVLEWLSTSFKRTFAVKHATNGHIKAILGSFFSLSSFIQCVVFFLLWRNDGMNEIEPIEIASLNIYTYMCVFGAVRDYCCCLLSYHILCVNMCRTAHCVFIE